MRTFIVPPRFNPQNRKNGIFGSNGKLGGLSAGNTVRVIGQGRIASVSSVGRGMEKRTTLKPMVKREGKPAVNAVSAAKVEKPVEKIVEKIVEAEKSVEPMTEKVETSVTLPELPIPAPVEEVKEAETAEELETPEPYLDEELYLDGAKEGGETSGELVAPETVEIKAENGGGGRKGKRRGKKHRKNR